ncbi:MAG: translation initiation factor IF-2 [Trueperaceae bacterium]|nr:translation initiation factor IF-2 [Trueperaceae bacterium]
MANKIRIYQLAKDLGLENKELLAVLDDLGVAYKSHASSLEADVAETVTEYVAAQGDGDAAPTEAAPSDATADPPAPETPAAEPEATEPEATESEATEPDATAPDATADAGRADRPLRAPVVTVMGHVDHGKTSLLDYVRKTRVAAKEAGGITQHIGAYVADTAHGPITFLDTPGHEAFTAIRQRGAGATDIAVIVVAADDSLMPQTREAIAHARAAGVPMIIAINKIDLPNAQPDKVKQDLMQVELVPEEFGGDTITVPISAVTGDGIPDLLEMIALVAELEDLRADPQGAARGVVIESILDKQAGVLATVLVQEGTLRVGDAIVSGEAWAKIRRLTDHTGATLKEAGPSVPVQVLGFSSQPAAGADVEAVESDAEARRLTQERADARETEEREAIGRKDLTLADLFGKARVTTLPIILRADTQGTLEAIRGVLEKESEAAEEVELDIMLADVGAPTESDLLLASTADAQVIAFGVNPPGSVKKSAERQGIPLKSYKIIYQLIEDVQRLIRGQIEPEYEEKVIGHAEVRAVIQVPRSGTIAGSYVTDGQLRRNAKARITRGGKEVYKGSIAGLKRFKDDVREVGQGFECGVNLQNYDNVQEGDVIEAYEMVEVPVV